MKNNKHKVSKIVILTLILTLTITIFTCIPPKKEESNSFVGVVFKKTGTSAYIYKIDEFDKEINVHNFEQYELSPSHQKYVPVSFTIATLKKGDILYITHPTKFMHTDTIPSPLPVYEIQQLKLKKALTYDKYNTLISVKIPSSSLPTNIQSEIVKDATEKMVVTNFVYDTFKINKDNYHFLNVKQFAKEKINKNDTAYYQYAFHCYFSEYEKRENQLYKVQEIKIPILVESPMHSGPVKFSYPEITKDDDAFKKDIQFIFPDHIENKALNKNIYELLKKEVILYSKNKNAPSIMYDANHIPIYVID